MAVSKAPKRIETPADTVNEAAFVPDEAQVLAIINKGGSVPGERVQNPPPAPDEDVKRGFELRLYQSMIDDIEQSRTAVKRGKKPSRNAWIVAAIEEKLERESQGR